MFQQLICDNPECDHKESVKDMSRIYIGKPCPKCGQNLLTEEDFEIADRMMNNPITKLLFAMGVLKPYESEEEMLAAEGDTKKHMVSVNPRAATNGGTKITFK